MRLLWPATAVALLANPCVAETLRVTTWNLGIGPETKSTAELVEQAASALRMLDPDVILLQQVQDWRMCERLTEALKPLDYNVLICSAFRGASPLEPAKPQVAILSKRQAYFTWSDAWRDETRQKFGDGVAFAAIQMDTQRLGFFNALFDDQQPGEDLAHRLLGEINSIGHWETNQVQTFVIAASLSPRSTKAAKTLRRANSIFDETGFIDATEEIPSNIGATVQPATAYRAGAVAERLFVGPMGFPTNARITASPASARYPVTCDVELDPDKVGIARDMRAEQRLQQQAQASLLTGNRIYWLGGVLGVGVAVLVAVWIVAKERALANSSRANRLPMRAGPSKTPSPLRPIVFARPPPTPRAAEQAGLPPAPRPVLRLQSPSRTEPRPAAQEPPAPPIPTNPPLAEHGDAAARQGTGVLQDTVLPHASTGHGASVREGIVQELTAWLKQKLLRRLVTDRAQLMAAQQVATHMATSLDNRLARIEAQIQQQNQAYVHRIEDLNRELAVAREENRELIRERIAQVKAEMEAARARVLAEADLDNTSLRL